MHPAAQPYLARSGLPSRWAGLASFTILDQTFGDGARFLAAWRAWRDDPARPRRLSYLAHSATGAMPPAWPAALQGDWPPAVAGLHRLEFDDGRVVLDLTVGPPASDQGQAGARVDAFFCDALAGAAIALARLAAPGATLVADRLGEAQRQALAKAGFVWQEDEPELPSKALFHGRTVGPARACATAAPSGGSGSMAGSRASGASGALGASDALDASNASNGPSPLRAAAPAAAGPQRRAIVIGAGLAGAAVCERLAARGWQVLLVERHAAPARQASGNLAGIFMPQLSRDDNPAARLSRAAFLYALRRWRQLGGIGAAFGGAACGVLQLARDAGHAEVQRQIAAGAGYPSDYARWLDGAAAGALLGAAAPDGGWLFPHGGWAHPGGVCQAMLAACGERLQRSFSTSALTLRRDGDQWQVLDADGATIGQAPTVILANGTGATQFAQAADLPLLAVRGQVTHLDSRAAAASLPQPPLVVCREAYMTPAADGVVCIGASYDADGDPGLRADSQRDNLAKIAIIMGRDAAAAAAVAAAPLAGRTGFRCVAPDRLPLVGALPDAAAGGRAERLRDVARWPGLYGLLGYASRGLIWAPLAAELLVAQLEDEALPLESNLVAALDPARFLLRQLRRHHAGAPP